MRKAKIEGTTLRIYLLLLGKKMGVREIQKALKISSPSVVHYHLTKLQELNLVKQDEYGRYTAVGGFDASYLGPFVILRGKVVPRYAFYGAFFTSFLISYSIMIGFSLPVIAISGIASLIFWIEAYLAYKGLIC